MSKVKTAKVFIQNIIFLLSNTPISKIEKIKYTEKISLIIYVIVEILIHIEFAISIVSQFAKNLSLKYFNAFN